MNADLLNKLYTRILATRGSTMTLKRDTVADLSFIGFMSGLSEKELVGDLQQGDRQVIFGTSALTAASWPQPIRKGDKVVCNSKTYTVQSADLILLNGTAVRYNLVVRG